MIAEQDRHVIHVSLDASDHVNPCPFCGLRPMLANTHTASYWLECDCGAEMHDQGRCGKSDSKRSHLASARRVLKAWNQRSL